MPSGSHWYYGGCEYECFNGLIGNLGTIGTHTFCTPNSSIPFSTPTPSPAPSSTPIPTPTQVPTPLPLPYSNFVFLTASYRAALNTTAQLNSVSYCGYPMQRVTGSRVKNGNQTNELWYLTNAPSGTCRVITNFDKDPEERIISAVTFYNIDTFNPIFGVVAAGNSTTTTSSGYLQVSSSSAKDSIMVCGYSVDPLTSISSTPSSIGSRSIWSKVGTSLVSGIASSDTRSSDNQSKEIKFTLAKVAPYSVSCANLKVKHMATPVPQTPTPIPTVIPTPITSPSSSSAPIPTKSPSPAPSSSPTSVVHTVTLVGRPISTTAKYFYFDAISENGTVTEQTSSRFGYTSDYLSANNIGASGGSWKYTGATGDIYSGTQVGVVKFTSSASNLILTSYACPSCGSYEVYVDGRFYTTVSTYSTVAKFKFNTTIPLSVPFHVIKLQNVPYPTLVTNPLPTVLTKYLFFDAILENGIALEENSPRVHFVNLWSPRTYNAAASGTYLRSATDGYSYVEFSTTASTVNLQSVKCANCGSVDIYVDGNYSKTLTNTLRSGSATAYKIAVPLYPQGAILTPAVGYKTVSLVLNTSVYPNALTFDAIIENGVKTEETSPRFIYESARPAQYLGEDQLPPWKVSTFTSASGGSWIQTKNNPKASVSFTTKATDLKVVYSSGGGSFDVYINGVFTKTIRPTTTPAYQAQVQIIP